MPTINKGKPRSNTVKYKHDDKSAKYYASPAYKDLRNLLIQQKPLCECCLQNEVITPSEELHHKKFILSGNDDAARWQLLLDPSNCIMLCKRCHKAMHKVAKAKHLQRIDSLTATEYRKYIADGYIDDDFE